MKAIDVLLEIIKEIDTGLMKASLCSQGTNVCLCSEQLIRYTMTISNGMVEIRGCVPLYSDPYPTVLEFGDPDLKEKLAEIISLGQSVSVPSLSPSLIWRDRGYSGPDRVSPEDF